MNDKMKVQLSFIIIFSKDWYWELWPALTFLMWNRHENSPQKSHKQIFLECDSDMLCLITASSSSIAKLTPLHTDHLIETTNKFFSSVRVCDRLDDCAMLTFFKHVKTLPLAVSFILHNCACGKTFSLPFKCTRDKS